MDNSMSRREALGMGTTLAAGFSLFPSIISSNALRRNAREFNVMDYGAEGDGTTLDTEAIQQAIDKASDAGGGARVLLPGGHSYLTGTIELKSNIDFHLADDAELLISTNREDYKTGAAITSRDIRNLRLSGTGNIEGQAKEFMTHYEEENQYWSPKDWRPRLFQLYTCKGLEAVDFSFGNSPLWGFHMVGCEDVGIDSLTIRNDLEVPNSDGINPDHCRNVEIKNCDIVAGDDNIVVKATRQDREYGPSANIHVYDCVLQSQSAAIKIGTETTSDIHDILFERCIIKDSNRGFGIQSRDEGEVYNITFRDIEFTVEQVPDIWWGLGEGISFTSFPRTLQSEVGGIRDIKLSNIKGMTENSIRINGSPESRIQNISLDNVDIRMNKRTEHSGGRYDNRPTEVYQGIEVHDNPGYSIQYADNISLNNCSIEWGENRAKYYTHALESEHVSGLKMTGFEGEAAHPDLYDSIVIY
ncbi:glycoside hydrolase family 28 protein [Halalkalibaculum sp. DA3122]|uniref:glycoside hydrolase family 28 protein n=1 Tax=Halalkalibaculum sp. DA3122 TaxID=3373607 RepID=UPI003754ADD6